MFERNYSETFEKMFQSLIKSVNNTEYIKIHLSNTSTRIFKTSSKTAKNKNL